MYREITIDLTVESINKAIKEIEKFQKEVETRLDLLCKRLAELGVSVVADDYGYTRGGEITVDWEKVEDGYLVTAAGKGVMFLEFGAGDEAGTGFMGEDVPVDTAPGSWSSTHGKQYSEKGYWVWNGHVFTSVAPRSGMYFASERIKQEVESVAREVFK